MQLPEKLRAALDEVAAQYKLSELREAHERLSEAYRAGRPLGALSAAERAAYAMARMPATYGACSAVLAEVRRRLEAAEQPQVLESLLDLGAGLGSMFWAASEQLPLLAGATLLDSDHEMMRLGQGLAGSAYMARSAEWRQGNAATTRLAPHDLVTCSYSLGEMSAGGAAQTLQAAWNAARKLLVVVEPGTPAGFARIREWRGRLIDLGAHVVAPCPHAGACPIVENDWCHFAQRIERTSLHRQMKGGALGYEDEKFSYIAFGKFPVALPTARIIRHPRIEKGSITLQLCASDGLRERAVNRRERERFRAARHAEWGETWETANPRNETS